MNDVAFRNSLCRAPAPYTNGRIICILDKPNVRTGEPHRGPHWGPDWNGRYVEWRDPK